MLSFTLCETSSLLFRLFWTLWIVDGFKGAEESPSPFLLLPPSSARSGYPYFELNGRGGGGGEKKKDDIVWRIGRKGKLRGIKKREGAEEKVFGLSKQL